MKLHKRLIEIESALEASFKAKQGELASNPTQIVIIVETAPLMTTTTIPRTSQTSEAGTSSLAPVSAITTTAAPAE